MKKQKDKLLIKKKEIKYSQSESLLDKSYRNEFFRIKLKLIRRGRKLDKTLKDLNIPKVLYIK